MNSLLKFSRVYRGLVRLRASLSTAVIQQTAPRPELDFDFLLDDANLQTIKDNIASRKGVGDIDAVRSKWAELQELMEVREKPQLTESQYKAKWDEFYDLAMRIPNMSLEMVPKGGEENANVLLEFGEKRVGDLLTAERLVNSWRALLHPTEAAGQRSYAFYGPLANLEKAVLDYAFERVCAIGFKPVTVPDIVPIEVTEACGVSQRNSQHMQYILSDEPSVAVSGTAEMGIAALLCGRTFQAEQLPVRLVAVSKCYRPEISKSANEAKLYRVHEFSKVEMFTVCEPSQSEAEMNYLVEIQKSTFESLGLHCRQLEMPSEELGASAARKVDIEAWMPGRGIYGEVSSASNCTDYQARRLGIQYKTKEGDKKFVHTCNGTAIASTRSLIALLETFQAEKKGLLNLPDVIRNRLKTQRPQPLRFKAATPLS